MNPAIRLIAIAAIIAAVAVLNWSTTLSMVALWAHSAYEHCYLIPVVSLYLLWDERSHSENLAWRGSFWGLALLGLSMVGLYAARTSLIQLLEHFFLLSGAACAVWAIAGDKIAHRHWFPLAYLMLCLPAGDTLIPTLQRVTADLCSAGLAMLGIPAFREGMMISLSSGQFEVARACSGFRYLNAGIALGALFAYLNLKSIRLMAVYVAFVVLVFILMNGIRAFLTILIAAASEMRYMTGDDHIVFGYVLFVGAISGVYWVATRMRAWEKAHA